MKTIGVIEDDQDLFDLLHYTLEQQGYRFVGSQSGFAGLQMCCRHHPDLILLGVMLIIRNDSMLIAEGTRSRPIIFTSSLSPGNRSGGDWGGVALLGNAPTNQVPNFIEGLPESEDTAIGGDDPTHNCGSLSYVRVEFAGAQLDQDNELNALTFGSCGNDTKAHHLQAHYGFDDSFEWFDGTNDVQYLVATAGADDGLDLQLGYTGRAQFYAVFWYDDAFGDHGIEADNRGADNSAEPFSEPQLYNATFIGNAICDDGCDGGRLRRGLKGTFANMVMTNFFDNTLQFTEQVTFDNLASGELSLNGLVVWNNEREVNAPNTIAGQFHRRKRPDVGSKPRQQLRHRQS